MVTLESITTVLGWCSVINLGILIVAAIALVPMRGLIISVHSKMFNLSEEHLSAAYLQYMAQYKLAIFVLNLVPYIALKIVT